MIPAELPPNESERVKSLRELEILDTAVEPLFDDITALASEICDAPISLISLVDVDRQWFKSRHGLGAEQTPREFAFCGHAILGDSLFEIEDSRLDERFHDNPLVTGSPNVVFYAGVPLEISGGIKVGTLCVIDNKPKILTTGQRKALRCLADQVIAQLHLRKLNGDLLRAMKARSAFFAAMSHEIRTPMNGILGITNHMLDSAHGAGEISNLSIIKNCGVNLLRILNDLLDYSRIESGKIEVERQAFQLGGMLRGAMEVIRPMAEAKGLMLNMERSGEGDWLYGDSARLSQILLNLMGNAVKFTQAGQVQLKVSCAPSTDAVGRMRLEIRIFDQGIGIHPEMMAKLFQPFSQLDASTHRKFGGTGLGLAIVKGLADSMGAGISVESQPGKGSTFTFALDCDAALPVPAPVRVSGMPGRLSDTKPMMILVAEDDEVNQVVILSLLAKLGYAADIACDGSEALEKIRLKPYDLVLMDCQMPGIDGFEATRRIHELYPAAGRPAIFAVTAGMMVEERQQCIAAGMQSILAKPLLLEELREALLACPVRGAA